MKVGRLERFERGFRKLREFVSLRGIRRDLLLADLSDGGPEGLMLLGGAVKIAEVAHRGSVARGVIALRLLYGHPPSLGTTALAAV